MATWNTVLIEQKSTYAKKDEDEDNEFDDNEVLEKDEDELFEDDDELDLETRICPECGSEVDDIQCDCCGLFIGD